MDSLNRKAAEQMAGRARECGTTVAELFANSREVRFDTPGHAGEWIERGLEITPALLAQAELILQSWEA